MSLHVTRICDRCGARESTLPAGKPIVSPVILPFSTKGLPEDTTSDLCRPCAAIVQSGLAKLLRNSDPSVLKLE